MTDDDKRDLRTEGNKLLHDSLKQLVTISSGSIVILMTFWEKVSAHPRAKWLVGLALVGFFVCIIASLKIMKKISMKIKYAYPKGAHRVRGWYPAAAVSFLVGVGFLVVFVVWNLMF